MDDDDVLTCWRTIPLTLGQRVMVDVNDYDELAKHKWFAFRRTYRPTGSTYFYACRRFRHEDGKQRGLLMHRHIMGAKKGQEVDHLNGITTDCRRANLRLTDRRGNQGNRKDHSPYGVGICYRGDRIRKGRKGVTKRDREFPFEARVFIRGKLHFVGQHATAAEARAARAAFLRDHA